MCVCVCALNAFNTISDFNVPPINQSNFWLEKHIVFQCIPLLNIY